jgi:hypothetical protein
MLEYVGCTYRTLEGMRNYSPHYVMSTPSSGSTGCKVGTDGGTTYNNYLLQYLVITEDSGFAEEYARTYWPAIPVTACKYVEMYMDTRVHQAGTGKPKGKVMTRSSCWISKCWTSQK